MLDGGSLQTAIKLANKDLYPNVFIILQVLLTLPVTSVCCERSFLSLRRLKTWERTTIGSDRLCGLAMLHVHRNDTVDKVRVLKLFDSTSHRRNGKFWLTQQGLTLILKLVLLLTRLGNKKKSAFLLYFFLIINTLTSPIVMLK